MRLAAGTLDDLFSVLFGTGVAQKGRAARQWRRACYLTLSWAGTAGVTSSACGFKPPREREVLDAGLTELAGLPRRSASIFPATTVRTCIVHRIRA
jgi:hypothetical protein